MLTNTFTLLKVKNIEKGTIRYYVEQDSGKFIRCSQGIFEYYESIANRTDCIYNTHKNGVARFYKTVYCK